MLSYFRPRSVLTTEGLIQGFKAERNYYINLFNAYRELTKSPENPYGTDNQDYLKQMIKYDNLVHSTEDYYNSLQIK